MSLRADTPEAREIWRVVDEVAKRCPDWIRPKVEQVSRELAEQIKERLAKMKG